MTNPGTGAASSPPPTQVAAGDRLDLGGVTVTIPEGWMSEPPANSMRQVQFRLPAEDGESGVIYVSRAGGSVRANVARWVGQYSQPDGRDSGEVAEIEEKTVDGMQVTTVDVTGTLTAPINMNNPAAGNQNVPNQRMIGAIVESPAGMFFYKATGPEDVLEKWESSIQEFIDSTASGQ